MTDMHVLPAKKRRPVALTVIAVIGIVYAASGLAGAVEAAVFAPLMTVLGRSMSGIYGSYNSLSGTFLTDLYGGFVPWLLLLAGIGIPLFLFGLIMNIGIVKNRPWTRTGATVFAALLYLEAVVTGIALFGMLIPFLKNMEGIMDAAYVSSFWSFYSTILKAMIVVSPLLSCVLPTIMLVILNKPAVKEHYRELQGPVS